MEKLNLHQPSKFIFTVVCCVFTFFSNGQEDTSNVFVIGDVAPVDIAQDTVIVKRRQITNCFKIDAGKAYSGVYLMSFEHLIDNDRWSLEYELSYDIDTERFWYDWYTDYKYSEPENNSTTFTGIFSNSYDFVFGGGIALKHYLSKKKSGIYGWYFGVKLKERYGRASVSNGGSFFWPFPTVRFEGFMNFLEFSAICGYSLCLWDFLVIDPFLGASAIMTTYRYGTFEEGTSGYYWEEKSMNRILPALHFGLRVGTSADSFSGLFF
jgi:hypothetical protein